MVQKNPQGQVKWVSQKLREQKWLDAGPSPTENLGVVIKDVGDFFRFGHTSNTTVPFNLASVSEKPSYSSDIKPEMSSLSREVSLFHHT